MLISEAFAQGASGGTGGMDILSPVMLGATFIALYFLVMRPQMKRAKEHKQILAALQKGDEVVTASGVLGRAARVGDNYVGLEIAPGVEIQVQKTSIQTVLPKGTIKSAS